MRSHRNTAVALSAALLTGFSLVAQENQSALEIGLQVGSSVTSSFSLPIETWNATVPQPDEPHYWNTADSGFYQSDPSYFGNLTPAFSLQLMKPADRKWWIFTPVFGLAAGYTYGAHARASWSHMESHLDPASGQGNGEVRDSTVGYNHWVEYRSGQLYVAPRIVLHTNRDKRFSFLIGLSVSAGVSVANRMTVYDQKNYIVFVSGPEVDNPIGGSGVFYYTTKSYRKDPAFICGVMVPIGVDVRLGMKENALGKMTVGVELSPGMRWAMLPEYGTKTLKNGNAAVTFKYRI